MRMFTLFFCILVSVASLTAYFYIDHKINAGQKLLTEGQKQYDEGQKKLAAGKEKLSAGKKKLSTAKGVYNSTLGLLHVVKVVPVAGPAANDAEKQVDVGGKMIADGDRQVAEGEMKVKAGEAALAAGKEQLANGRTRLDQAKSIRLGCLISTFLFGFLAIFIAVYFRRR